MEYSQKFENLINRIVNNKLKLPNFDLQSVDGNAFSLMGHWQKAARKAGWSQEDIDVALEQFRSGNYDDLVSSMMDVCTTGRDQDDFEEEQEEDPEDYRDFMNDEPY